MPMSASRVTALPRRWYAGWRSLVRVRLACTAIWRFEIAVAHQDHVRIWRGLPRRAPPAHVHAGIDLPGRSRRGCTDGVRRS
jgi:hypothetical protein